MFILNDLNAVRSQPSDIATSGAFKLSSWYQTSLNVSSAKSIYITLNEQLIAPCKYLHRPLRSNRSALKEGVMPEAEISRLGRELTGRGNLQTGVISGRLPLGWPTRCREVC